MPSQQFSSYADELVAGNPEEAIRQSLERLGITNVQIDDLGTEPAMVRFEWCNRHKIYFTGVASIAFNNEMPLPHIGYLYIQAWYLEGDNESLKAKNPVVEHPSAISQSQLDLELRQAIDPIAGLTRMEVLADLDEGLTLEELFKRAGRL